MMHTSDKRERERDVEKQENEKRQKLRRERDFMNGRNTM
jgi:hypothetical protein